MSEALYKIYRDDTIDLVGMVVYNHRIEATTMNVALAADDYIVSDIASTWRYYLNMAGLYHAWDENYVRGLNPDGSPLMKIVIAGASGPLEVDLTLTLIHGVNADPGISLVYAYGSRAYKQLVERYPECESLIFGIFYPVDINVSTQAEDGDILFIAGYERVILNDRFFFAKPNRANLANLNLIHPNEITLINDLETWIKNMIFRWFVKDYAVIEDLYLACFISVLTAFCVPRVMKFRIDRCKTSEAHPFHVRQYLNDYGNIGSVVDFLPIEAVHYLYRNADMLAHETGRTSTTAELVERFLDPSGIPLTRHRLRQDLTTIETEYTPIPYADTKDLGSVKSLAGNQALDVTGFEQKIIAIAPENPYDLERIVSEETESISARYADYAPTKTLESRISLSSSEPRYRFVDLLMNLWAFTASMNQYQGTILMKHPITAQTLALSPKNALAIAYYCFSVGYHGIVPSTVPVFKATFIPKTSAFTPNGYYPRPSTDNLHGIYRQHFSKDFIERFAGTVEPTYSYNSPPTFFADAKRLYSDLRRRDLMLSMTPDAYTRNRGTEMLTRFYWFDFTLNGFNDRSYSDLLSFLGLDFNGLSSRQMWNYYQELIIQSLGLTGDTEENIRRKQEIAMEVMRYFSSYAVHYVHSTSAGRPVWLGGSVVRSAVKASRSLNKLENPTSAINHQIAPSASFSLRNTVGVSDTRISMNLSLPVMENRVSIGRSDRVTARQSLASPAATVTTRLEVTYL